MQAGWRGHRIGNLLDDLVDMFNDVLHLLGVGMDPNDLGRVLILHQELDSPIVVPLKPWQLITPDLIRRAIENVLNRRQSLTLDDSFHIIVAVHVMRGEERPLPITNESLYKRKYGITSIKNTDNKCMVRALAIAYAHTLEVPTTEEIRFMQC